MIMRSVLESSSIVFIGVICLILAQNEGDIRLVGQGSHSNKTFGRVQIFYRHRWGTICDHNYAGAANVICYQLNHSWNSWVYPGTNTKDMNESIISAGTGMQIERISNSTPIHLRDIDCGAIYSNPPDTIHILRCAFTNVQSDSECTHDDDLAVFCDSQTNTGVLERYDSEVRLVGGNFTSSGMLEIYLKKEWGNICYSGFSSLAANTTCRQMGYTHAVRTEKSTSNTTSVVWFRSLSCGKHSHECLSHCFDKHKIYQRACSDGYYVLLHCGFNINMSNVTSGNPIMCLLTDRYTRVPAFFVAIMSVSGIVWLVAVVVIVITSVCYSVPNCLGYKQRRKMSENDDQDDTEDD